MILYLPYARERALAYAARWALGRNPLFYDFSALGGDCTNFVSQCLLAGLCVQNFTPDFGWYYLSVEDRAPAFTGVEPFWRFMTGAPDFAEANGGLGPYGREVSMDGVIPGDVVQFGNENGNFYHTALVMDILDGEVLVAAHSNDVYGRRLSSYRYGSVRFLHLEGARVESALPDCYANLLSGEALPTEP